MASVTARVEVSVRLEIPDDLAAKITKSDIVEMFGTAVGHNASGLGVQVVADGKAQWHGTVFEKSDPVMASAFVDGWIDDAEIEIEDDGFDALEKELENG